MEGCIFCRIVRGEIPCKKVYENDLVLAFDDIQPMAPHHVIVIPKRHIPTLLDVSPAEYPLLGAMIAAGQEVARIKGVDQRGFRTVMNVNAEGGQVVYHLHMHVLGGRKLKDDLG